MIKPFNYVLVVLLLTVTTSLLADIKNYRIRVPAQEENCERNAQLHAIRFYEATGTEVKSYRCQGRFSYVAESKNYELDSLAFEYERKVPLEIKTTKFRTAESLIQGKYTSYQQCLDDLARQSQIFKSETGLKIIRASCEKMPYGFKNNYQLQIDTYGVAKNDYQWVTIAFLEKVTSSFKQAVVDQLSKLGASNISEYGTSFYFYRKHSIPLFSETVARYDSALHCETQKINLLNALKSLNAKWSTVECSLDDKIKNYYHLNVAYMSSHYLSNDFGYSSPQYYSMEECLADFERFVANAVNSGHAAGGVCEDQIGNDGIFVIKLFKRPII
jgi:hypothetical protein